MLDKTLIMKTDKITTKLTTTINGKKVDCWLEKDEDNTIVLRAEKHNINHEGVAIVGLTTKGKLQRYYEAADLALGLVSDVMDTDRMVVIIK